MSIHDKNGNLRTLESYGLRLGMLVTIDDNGEDYFLDDSLNGRTAVVTQFGQEIGLDGVHVTYDDGSYGGQSCAVPAWYLKLNK